MQSAIVPVPIASPGVSENRLMNRRVWFCVGLLSIIACSGRLCLAQAQPAGPAAGAGVPALQPPALSIQQAADAGPNLAQINQFVDAEFASLASLNPADRRAARVGLIAGCAKTVSPSYAQIYTKEVNAQLLKFMALPSLTPPQRLNGAIVLFFVAQNAQNLVLEPAIHELLSDREAGVVYWAMKAADPLLQLKVETAGSVPGSQPFKGDTLVPAMVACVKGLNPKDEVAGLVVDDAYRALSGVNVNGLSPAQLKTATVTLIDPTLDILEFRITSLTKDMIATPGAEKAACTFLSSDFAVMTPVQQQRTIQDLVNLITVLGTRSADYDKAAAAAAKVNVIMQRIMSELHGTIKTDASAISVVCNSPAITASIDWLLKLPPGALPPVIEQHTSLVFGAVQTAFKATVQPPAVLPIPAPAGAAAPGAAPAAVPAVVPPAKA